MNKTSQKRDQGAELVGTVEMKVCTQCGVFKSLDEFYVYKGRKDKKCAECKECTISRANKHYDKNKEVIKKRCKKYYDKNREANIEKT